MWLYFHIDFGVCARSTFQHIGAAFLAPPLGGVWGCFLPCLLLSGVAWPPLGGVLGGATFPLSSVGRCCLASFLRCCCVFPLVFSGAAFLSLLWVVFPFSLSHHMMGWMLGCWAVGSTVGVLGGSVCGC